MTILTEVGETKVSRYLKSLRRQRKEILAAGKDTADETELPNKKDILSDIEYWVDGDGDYYNNWQITDNCNSKNMLCLSHEKDFIRK